MCGWGEFPIHNILKSLKAALNLIFFKFFEAIIDFLLRNIFIQSFSHPKLKFSPHSLDYNTKRRSISLYFRTDVQYILFKKGEEQMIISFQMPSEFLNFLSQLIWRLYDCLETEKTPIHPYYLTYLMSSQFLFF